MKKIFGAISCALAIAGVVSSCGSGIDSGAATGSSAMSVDEALAKRQSVRYYSAENKFSEKELLELLWAANGVTREDGRRTAPSAVNAQDIELYTCSADGVSKYDALEKKLSSVTSTDIRPFLKAQNEFAMDAPVIVLLVSDQTRFGTHRSAERNRDFGMIDAGIVSENISLYCTAHGLSTVCCAPRMLVDSIRTAIGLPETSIPILYHPVGK